MLIDARSVDDGATLECELCVVGAGPAGISIVDRLRDSGLSICLLESGAFEPELRTQRLYRGTTLGYAYYPLHACRYRLFGGTTNRWGGWCRPLDPMDFEERDWVSASGWPIDHRDLEPYSQDAAALLQIPEPRFHLGDWDGALPEPLPIDGGDFEHAIYQYSPRTNFGEAYRSRILSAGSVRTLVRANATNLRLSSGGQVIDSVHVQTLSGRSFAVRARAVVLATGGIENARLLLASREQCGRGIGNEHDVVGRYFMEHLHVPAGHLLPTAAATDRSFYSRASYGGSEARGVITPRPDAQRRRQLLTCSIALEPERYSLGTPYLAWPPEVTFGPLTGYQRLRRGRGAGIAERARLAAENAWYRRRRLTTLRLERDARLRGGPAASRPAPLHSLYVRAEQAPNRESRVTLAPARDALGVPLAQLDWRLADADMDSIVGWLTALNVAVRSRGLGQVIMPRTEWRRRIAGGPHHMGTTRMSADPKRGVVDHNCRLHSVENLYVAGSSVFATGGHANPTFPLGTLALRLADHLRATLT
jgi:choline dehydrogenase-like flavoprotein